MDKKKYRKKGYSGLKSEKSGMVSSQEDILRNIIKNGNYLIAIDAKEEKTK